MSIVTKKTYHLSGLSTDTKPIPEDIATGSTYFETDTGMNFVFNRSLNQWIPTSEKIEPQVNAPCVGILSIELTSREGLVDTYTIRYTNGASTTFTVTNGEYIDPNIDIDSTLIDNKIYTIDLNTESFNLYKLFKIDGSMETADTISTGLIDHTKFWPRVDESKFIVHAESDLDLLFNYTGTVAAQDIWQAFMIDEENKFIRFVGHFEYENENDKENSDFYFIATKQAIDFINLRADLDQEVQDRIADVDDEELRATARENEIANDLAAETTRATDAEEVLTNNLAAEVTRAIDEEGRIDTKLDTEIQDRENDVDAEETRAKGEEERIEAKLDAEISDRIADVEAEETRATNEENRIDTKLDDYIITNNRALAKEIEDRTTAINSLDLSQVGSNGNYIKFVSQEDGQVAAQKQAFDTTINANSTDVNAPTSKAVKDHVQAEINKLDVASIGANRSYIKFVEENNGIINATAEQFDNTFNNPTDNNAPTTLLVKTYVDSVDDEIKDDLADEIARATDVEADLRADLNTEITSRTTGDNNLGGRIDTEITNRTNADTALGDRIDALASQASSDVEAEETRATAAEAALGARINALDLQPTGSAGSYIKTVAQADGQLSATVQHFDIDLTDITNDNAPTTKLVDDTYSKILETVTNLSLSLDTTTYVLTVNLKNRAGTVVAYDTVDLPIESLVTTASYDAANKKIILTLKSGATIEVPVAALISGLQAEITAQNKLSSDLVDDANKTHKFATAAQLTQISTNQNAIAAIKDGNSIDSFRDVEDALALKANQATTYTKTESDNLLSGKVDKVTGYVLSKNDYSDAEKLKVTENTAARHIHANQNLLDDYRQTEADLATAVTNTHTHSNNQILDDTTASFTVAYKNQLDTTAVSVDYDHTKFYKTLPTGQGNTIVTVDTLSADLAAANTLSISGAHGSITAAQYSKLNKETIVIWEAPDHSGNVALHYSSLVNINEPCYQGFYGLPFTDGMITVLVTFSDDLTWEVIYDGAIAETTANRVSAFQNTPDNTHYPTEKLVKDNLDTKANLDAENVFTGKNTFSVPEVNSGLGFLITPSNPQNMRSKVSLYVKGPTIIENPSFDDELPTRIFGSTKFEQLGDPGVGQSQSVVFNIPARFDRYTLFKDASNAYVRTTLTVGNEAVNCDTSLSTISDFFWNTFKAYAVGDIIFYNRALYICEAAVSASSAGNTNPATDTTHWTKLFTNQA